MQFITQPLYNGTGYKNAAFEGVLYLTVYFPGNGSYQVILRYDGLIADVHQHKTTCTVGVFYHAVFGTHLAKEGRLLIASYTGYGYLRGQHSACRFTVHLA